MTLHARIIIEDHPDQNKRAEGVSTLVLNGRTIEPAQAIPVNGSIEDVVASFKKDFPGVKIEVEDRRTKQ